MLIGKKEKKDKKEIRGKKAVKSRKAVRIRREDNQEKGKIKKKTEGQSRQEKGSLSLRLRGRPLQKKELLLLAGGTALLLCLAAGLTAAGVNAYRHRQAEVMARQEREEQEAVERARLEEEARKKREAQELVVKRREYWERQRRKIAGQKKLAELRAKQAEVKLPEENADAFVSDISCEITGGRKRVSLFGRTETIPQSDDGYYYLFSIKSYEEGLREGQEPILAAVKRKEFRLTANLYRGEERSRLFDKFLVAVKENGAYVPVSKPVYITNPEGAASFTQAFPETASKKGLLVDPARLSGGELEDLGVRHAAYNIPVANIIGGTTNATYPTIPYNYQGKTYYFNGQTMAEYDLVFSTLSKKGIVITAILLNNRSGAYPYLVHPKAQDGSAPYYMFNATDQTSADHLAAIGTFLAERYSGKGYGRVDNWVIANEINARKAWNYMEYMGVKEYTDEYAKAFRIFYTAIRSVNANARVYLCLDQTWNRNLKTADTYDARDVLDAFNERIREEGQLDWGVAYHPYPVPLTWAKFWDMPGNYKRMGLILDSVDTPMISPENVHVLTDYLRQENFLDRDGRVRPVLLSEVGFTSAQGEAVQGEALERAFAIVNANPHIDALLLNRQTDAPEEVAQGLAFGLNHADGSHKAAYGVYKSLK